MKKKMTLISILSVAFVAQIRGSLNPMMENLYQYYSLYPMSVISLFTTIVSITVIPVSYLCSRLVGIRISYKKAIILMNICLLFGGVGPYFFNSIYIVLLFRIIFGIGIGIAISLNKPIIMEYYDDHKQLKYLGYTS